MSPSERQARAVQKGLQGALTHDEELRITEGEYIRREMPIGERSHLKRMLQYLLEQEAKRKP